MSELFVELLSEEVPARMQLSASQQLAKKLKTLLDDNALGGEDPRVFSTPRRLVVVINDVAERQADQTLERRGPRVDAPAKAREGFLRGLGDVDYTLDEIEDKKGRFLLARFEQKGRSSADILAEAMPALLEGFSWPKAMRWGEGSQSWVRPLHRITCLLDGRIVPFTFAGIESGRTSEGHRFMAPEPFEVADFAGYVRELSARNVVLDPVERRKTIQEQAVNEANALGYELRDDPGLLDELTGLVEWPIAISGRIDDAFMSLPSEVLVTSMREHQKFMALQDQEGKLAPHFITIANLAADDGGDAIRSGNEYVLRARLWDARFFWDQDRKTPLDQRLPALEAMVFHAELGTLREKVDRITSLAEKIAQALDLDQAGMAEAGRAARLAKADLVTGMVGEFPELQGIMGGYYAKEQGEHDDIAGAIRDHYRPQGPSDGCPSAPISVAVALADKIDSLIGFFAASIKPTGSKDPFALRRAGLGVIRLVSENDLHLPLNPVFDEALKLYGDRFSGNAADTGLLGFLIERLKVYLRGVGYRHDVIEAALKGDAADDLTGSINRVRILTDHVAGEPGQGLLSACKRAMNILVIEEKRDGGRIEGHVDVTLLNSSEEQTLNDVVGKVAKAVEDAMGKRDTRAALSALEALTAPLDSFFEAVLVNDNDPAIRSNRLGLLSKIRTTALAVVDFAAIEQSSPNEV